MPLLQGLSAGASTSAHKGQGTIPLGTLSQPAISGVALKNLNYPSGNYYIKPTGYTGAAIQCYVDNDNQGGGWVLIGKGRQDNQSLWFGADTSSNEGQTTSAYWLDPTVSKVNASFVNCLMSGSPTSGWGSKYIIVNRRADCTDGLGGIGDSASIQVTNQTAFSWVGQFSGDGTDVSASPSGTVGNMTRYLGYWLGGGVYGTPVSGAQLFDNYFGGGNDVNRWFQWHWSGHSTYAGWSGGQATSVGFQTTALEGHRLQHAHVWAK